MGRKKESRVCSSEERWPQPTCGLGNLLWESKQQRIYRPCVRRRLEVSGGVLGGSVQRKDGGAFLEPVHLTWQELHEGVLGLSVQEVLLLWFSGGCPALEQEGG